MVIRKTIHVCVLFFSELTPEMEKITELGSKVDVMIDKLKSLTDVKEEEEKLKEDIEKFKKKRRILIG